jgi:hypothetical protein
MTIVDTHCHIGVLKYEPVESLVYMMGRSKVDEAVFIQYAGNTDNSYGRFNGRSSRYIPGRDVRVTRR